MSKGSKRRPTPNYVNNYDSIDWKDKKNNDKKDNKKLVTKSK